MSKFSELPSKLTLKSVKNEPRKFLNHDLKKKENNLLRFANSDENEFLGLTINKMVQCQ